MQSKLIAAMVQQDADKNRALLEILFNNISAGIQLLSPVYNKKNGIIDFSFSWPVMPQQPYCGPAETGQSLKKLDGNVTQFDLINKFAQVFKNGTPLIHSISVIGGNTLVLKVQRFDDKLLLWQDNIETANTETVEPAVFLQRIAEATPDLIFLMNIRTKEIFYHNRFFATELGYSDSEIDALPHPIFSLMFEPDLPLMMKFIDDFRFTKEGEIREIEYRLRDSEGKLHWFHDRCIAFKRDAEGMVTEKLGISHDATQRKLQEEQINELNMELIRKNRALESANSEINTFTTIAANHYKETLRNLYTSMEFIISNDAAKLSNEGRANLRRSQAAIQKMKLLTEDIVSFSGISLMESVPEEADLNAILKTALNDLRTKIESSGIIITTDDLPAIQGYPLLLSLLFYHLIDNSIKFSSEQNSPKELSIIYEKIPGEKGGVPGSKRPAVHCIRFKDNGIGFCEDEGEEIFNMFHQLHQQGKYKGSGIGLAVCKKIMDIHDGNIAAQGKPGESCMITCCFPE